MIPSVAITGYLERKLESHKWVKRLTAKQLEEALSRLPLRPDLTPQFRLHQKACFLLGVAYPQFCFFLDMGTGKTLLSLELLRYWWEAGKVGV